MGQKYLCDTNVFLEILLQRGERISCSEFMNQHLKEIAVTDFGLFSFCIQAERHRCESAGFSFIHDLFQSGIQIISTEPLKAIQSLFEKTLTSFDYDDYIQYRIAKEHHLALVTLDKDFFKKKLDIRVLRPHEVQ